MKKNIKIGDKFGKWKVTSGILFRKNKKPYYLCLCLCGVEKPVCGANLKSGKSTKCSKCRIAAMKSNPPAYKHGGKYRRLSRCWLNMLYRCYDNNSTSYKDYGGRGILVCPQWKEFDVFKKWALNNGYKSTLTIDRINNNGNYEPLNCKWATYAEQARNKRNNTYHNAFGENKIIADWVNDPRCVVVTSTLENRIYRNKWKVEHALTFPKNSGSSYTAMKRRLLCQKDQIPKEK